ncbi:MAG: metal-dependent hydrolase [Planctomycetaceae bacterium]|jgi:L-ascorbate metabolism protein UlaG (beta-lactamase superfamily)|nr:metal-dependent hydrolase [Planctomycetaceae bacterium]
MTTKIQWHGHSNFQISEDGVNIIVDPFFPTDVAAWKRIAPPDLVLVTHDHSDHVGSAVEICRLTGAMLGCVVGTAEPLLKRGLPQSQVLNGIGFNIGGTVSFRNTQITMTQAFHSSDSGVPVGYIVKMPSGFTWYHAGDTGIFASMEILGKLYPIDTALLPMGGVFTMEARQAALACSLLQAKSVIPMHWGTFPVLSQNTDRFREELTLLCPDCRFIALKPGECDYFLPPPYDGSKMLIL